MSDESNEYTDKEDYMEKDNLNRNVASPKKDVYDYKWWHKFTDLGEEAHREFFYGNHPMKLKQKILENFIWENLISYDLVVRLIPDVVNIDFFNQIFYGFTNSTVKIEDFELSFMGRDYINKDILDYLFDIYPLSKDSSQITIQNLAVYKMPVPYLNQVLRDNSMGLTLDTFEICVHKIQVFRSKNISELTSFVETCLETSKWKCGEILNGALEIALNVRVYLRDANMWESVSNMWKTITSLFIEHGYDPLQHEINIINFSHQAGLLEYLVEIMDPDKLATSIITNKPVINGDNMSTGHCYNITLKTFEILAVSGVDLSSLFRANSIPAEKRKWCEV